MSSSDQPTGPVPPWSYRRRYFRRRYFLSAFSSTILIVVVGLCLFSRFLFGFSQFNGAEGAAKVAARITDWAPPSSFVGKQGVVFDNFAMQFDFALFEHEEGRGVLVIAQLHPRMSYALSDKRAMTGEDQPETAEKGGTSNSLTEKGVMAKQFINLLAPDLKNLDLKTTENKELVVREKPAKFEIGSGEDRATTTKMRQMIGEFQGKVDDAIVILQCEESFLDEKQIEDFLRSIK